MVTLSLGGKQNGSTQSQEASEPERFQTGGPQTPSLSTPSTPSVGTDHQSGSKRLVDLSEINPLIAPQGKPLVAYLSLLAYVRSHH
jgi:hypothetical protein